MKNIGAVVALIVLFTANPAQALSMGGPGGMVAEGVGAAA
jgi:hypothetical protein